MSMTTVKPKGSTITGIDVYSGNSETLVQNNAKSSFAHFVFHKASEGLTYKDGKLHARIPGFRALGKTLGFYHFFHPNKDGAAQAQNFFDACKGLVKPGDFIWLDWEVNDGVSPATDRQQAHAFLQKADQLFGIRCGIYGAPYFLQDVILDASYAQRILWIANYEVSAPRVPAPWKNWQFWQYNGTTVDKNYFNGTEDDLHKLAQSLVIRAGHEGHHVDETEMQYITDKGYAGVSDGHEDQHHAGVSLGHQD